MTDFVYLFRATIEGSKAAMGTPEMAQKSMQAWMAWIRDLEARGHLKNPGQPLEHGGKVISGSARTITDGPYAETKDIVLGFIVVQARDIDQAVELAAACPMVEGGGAVEVRPVQKMAFA